MKTATILSDREVSKWKSAARLARQLLRLVDGRRPTVKRRGKRKPKLGATTTVAPTNVTVTTPKRGKKYPVTEPE